MVRLLTILVCHVTQCDFGVQRKTVYVQRATWLQQLAVWYWRSSCRRHCRSHLPSSRLRYV